MKNDHYSLSLFGKFKTTDSHILNHTMIEVLRRSGSLRD